MSSTVSCSSAAQSVSVSSRSPAQIFATSTGWVMKSSPDLRRWSAWRSQAKAKARSIASRSSAVVAVGAVLADHREQVAEQRALLGGQVLGDLVDRRRRAAARRRRRRPACARADRRALAAPPLARGALARCLSSLAQESPALLVAVAVGDERRGSLQIRPLRGYDPERASIAGSLPSARSPSSASTRLARAAASGASGWLRPSPQSTARASGASIEPSARRGARQARGRCAASEARDGHSSACTRSANSASRGSVEPVQEAVARRGSRRSRWANGGGSTTTTCSKPARPAPGRARAPPSRRARRPRPRRCTRASPPRPRASASRAETIASSPPPKRAGRAARSTSSRRRTASAQSASTGSPLEASAAIAAIAGAAARDRPARAGGRGRRRGGGQASRSSAELGVVAAPELLVADACRLGRFGVRGRRLGRGRGRARRARPAARPRRSSG